MGALYKPKTGSAFGFRHKDAYFGIALSVKFLVPLELVEHHDQQYYPKLKDVIVLIVSPDDNISEARMINTESSWERFERVY